MIVGILKLTYEFQNLNIKVEEMQDFLILIIAEICENNLKVDKNRVIINYDDSTKSCIYRKLVIWLFHIHQNLNQIQNQINALTLFKKYLLLLWTKKIKKRYCSKCNWNIYPFIGTIEQTIVVGSDDSVRIDYRLTNISLSEIKMEFISAAIRTSLGNTFGIPEEFIIVTFSSNLIKSKKSGDSIIRRKL